MNRFRLVAFILLFFGILQVNAQQIGNEWIDYDLQYYKIKTGQDEIHRLGYNELLAAIRMANPSATLGEVNPRKQKHLQFEGYDIDETGFCYGGSIPMDKAVDGLGDCIFAYEMNGKPLPRDHGYPVRAIVPGHADCWRCEPTCEGLRWWQRRYPCRRDW